jgi:hypothetical protein
MRRPNVAIAYIEPIAEQVCNLRGQDEAWILSTFGSCATATPVAQPSGAASAAIASLGLADLEPELMHAVGSTHPVHDVTQPGDDPDDEAGLVVDDVSGMLAAPVPASADGDSPEAAAHGECDTPVSSIDGLSSSCASSSDEGAAGGEVEPPDSELAATTADVSQEVVNQITANRERRARSVPEQADITRLFRHMIRKTIHYGHLENEDLTGCGRALNDKHEQVFIDPSDYWPKCGGCFPV